MVYVTSKHCFISSHSVVFVVIFTFISNHANYQFTIEFSC